MLMAHGDLNRQQALSPQSRPCPPDFEIVFIEQGRLECEPYFHARRTTVTRWLEECGKKRLLGLRAAFVKNQRQARKAKAKTTAPAPLADRRKVDPKLVALAIHHLQARQNGGWAIVPCKCGNYIVGTVRRSPADVVAMAERKGFNRRRALEQIKAFAEQV